MTDQFAPSEEHALFCDVPNCEAALSMVSGVPRSEHGWGRITLYDATKALPAGDYDLCPLHYQAVQVVLNGEHDFDEVVEAAFFAARATIDDPTASLEARRTAATILGLTPEELARRLRGQT